MKELEKLIFTFDENSVLDYQVLISLLGELYSFNIWESNSKHISESLLHLINLFGLDLNQKVEINLDTFEQWNIKNYKESLLQIYQILIVNDLIVPEQFYQSFFQNILKKIETQYFDDSKYQNSLFDTCILKTMNNFINPQYLKEYLLRKHLKEYKCDCCGLNEWQNEPLMLFLNFIDGNIENQNLENLLFLCPNCASQIGRKILL